MRMFQKALVLPLVALMGLPGCSLLQSDKNAEPPVNLKTVNISLDSDANQDSALAIDLLMIYKKELLEAVMKMPARDYYLSADQIKRDYPEMIDIWHWELTPGQVVKNYPVTHRCDPPVGAVFFADYLTPGDHRVRFGTQNQAHVRAKRFDFCVLEQGCSSDLHNRSITARESYDNPESKAIAGGMAKEHSQGGGPAPKSKSADSNPLEDFKKAEKSAQKEIKGFKKDIEGFKKLF